MRERAGVRAATRRSKHPPPAAPAPGCSPSRRSPPRSSPATACRRAVRAVADAGLRLAGHQHLAAGRRGPRRLDVVGVFARCLLRSARRRSCRARGRSTASRWRSARACRRGSGRTCRRSVRQPARISHMKASPEPLCSPKVRKRAVALGGIAHMRALDRAVQRARIGRQRAVRLDQRTRRHRLAAVGGDQHLALGDQRGGEIQHQRPLAPWGRRCRPGWWRSAGSTPPNGATSSPPKTLTKWMRDQPGLGRALAPVADAPDMAGVAQPDHGQAVLLRLGDAEIDRLRRRRSGRSPNCRRRSRASAFRARC